MPGLGQYPGTTQHIKEKGIPSPRNIVKPGLSGMRQAILEEDGVHCLDIVVHVHPLLEAGAKLDLIAHAMKHSRKLLVDHAVRGNQVQVLGVKDVKEKQIDTEHPLRIMGKSCPAGGLLNGKERLHDLAKPRDNIPPPPTSTVAGTIPNDLEVVQGIVPTVPNSPEETDSKVHVKGCVIPLLPPLDGLNEVFPIVGQPTADKYYQPQNQ